ncbi:MAG TPA: ABC transporter permease [Edaphobacter sp.]|nr:ABC transporter permease [Edaphobacter sp.]
MASWRQDILYNLRRLFRAPVFVLTVVLSIGIGVAANVTIFSMVNRFVLRPAPVGDPATLMALHTTHDGDRCCNNFSMPLYEDVRDQAKSFSGVAAYYELLPASIGGKGNPERVWGQSTTTNFFDVAQLPMTFGRGFNSGETRSPVIVLSYNLWRQRFNADPNIVGKSVSVSGHPYTVVGVTAPAFHGIDQILYAQFWVPLGNIDQLTNTLPHHDGRDFHWLAVIGRLNPGITHAQASAELSTMAKRFAVSYPKTDKGIGFRFEQAGSLPPRQASSVLMFLGMLAVVSLLVLCIACANVANLLLARAADRQREMAVRLALGATRARLLRQTLIESILLSLGGGVFGALLSLWATRGLSSMHLPAPVPLDISVGFDWRVLTYAFAISVISGLLCGAIPAWIASRPLVANSLKGEDSLARPGNRFSLRNVLVVSQVAMSVVLLCATGLFLRSLDNAANIDVGFRKHGVLMMAVDPSLHGYTPQHTVQFLDQLRDRVAAIPGVTSAAITDITPLSGGGRSDGFSVPGHKSDKSIPTAELYMATPGYLETMGIPLVAGRDLGRENPTGQKVAIISESMAAALFGKENPIGQHVNGAGVDYEVIGIAKNIKARTLGEDLRPVLYRSLDQSIGSDPSGMGYSLLVHTSGSSASVAAAVRQTIHSMDPTLAIFNAETIETHLRNALFLPRLAGTLFGIFGLSGLLLASIGLYGVMSYSVSRRRQEIGVRMALGAQIAEVQRLFVGKGMKLVVIAVAIGLPTAFAVSKFASSVLYGVRPHDLFTFTAVPLLLLAVALLACWAPARRAAAVNPIEALRCDG